MKSINFFISGFVIVTVIPILAFSSERNYEANLEPNPIVQPHLNTVFQGVIEETGDVCHAQISMLPQERYSWQYYDYEMSVSIPGRKLRIASQNDPRTTGVHFAATSRKIDIKSCDTIPCVFGGRRRIVAKLKDGKPTRFVYSSDSDSDRPQTASVTCRISE